MDKPTKLLALMISGQCISETGEQGQACISFSLFCSLNIKQKYTDQFIVSRRWDENKRAAIFHEHSSHTAALMELQSC